MTARASLTAETYVRAAATTDPRSPDLMAFVFTRSAPSPKAHAPAAIKSLAVESETPPVGTSLIWGSGAFRARRYFGPPTALQGKTFTASAPACHAVTTSVGVSAPGKTAISPCLQKSIV